jgi:hypothetical protein
MHPCPKRWSAPYFDEGGVVLKECRCAVSEKDAEVQLERPWLLIEAKQRNESKM